VARVGSGPDEGWQRGQLAGETPGQPLTTTTTTGLTAARPHAEVCFHRARCPGGSHQTPQPQICISKHIWTRLVLDLLLSSRHEPLSLDSDAREQSGKVIQWSKHYLHNDIRQRDAYGQELPCAFRLVKIKNTAKMTVPHMLAFRQIAWLKLTGSQSSALELITVWSFDNLLHQQSTDTTCERRLTLSKCRKQ